MRSSLGRGSSAVFDTLANEAGRNAHLSREIAKALGARANELLAAPRRLKSGVNDERMWRPKKGKPDRDGNMEVRGTMKLAVREMLSCSNNPRSTSCAFPRFVEKERLTQYRSFR